MKPLSLILKSGLMQEKLLPGHGDWFPAAHHVMRVFPALCSDSEALTAGNNP